MTEGDQVGGALGAHHAGDLGDGADIPFPGLAGEGEGQGLGRQPDIALGDGLAVGRSLVRDVHHPGATFGVDVRQAAHFSSSRGISSTMLQGPWRLSSWAWMTLSQPSFTAPFDPGRQKTKTPLTIPAVARDCRVDRPTDW